MPLAARMTPMTLPSEIEDRWTRPRRAQARRVLDRGARPLPRRRPARSRRVLRRIDQVPWWSYRLARHLFARERRALARRRSDSASRRRCCSPAVVRWCAAGSTALPLHIAKPHGDAAYFRSAKAALAQAAPRRHLPQRSRQGTELAARTRRPRLSHRFSARRAFSRRGLAVPASRPTRTCGTCSSTSAAMRPTRSPLPSGACWRRRAC